MNWTDQTIPFNSSIAKQTITKTPEDNEEMKNHPVPTKMQCFYNAAKSRYTKMELKTDGGYIINKKIQEVKWTVNRNSKPFTTTMWIHTGTNSTKTKDAQLRDFKKGIYGTLSQLGLYLDLHLTSMSSVAESTLGWILGVYPEACNIGTIEFKLNSNIKKHFDECNYHEWCRNKTNPHLQNWDGETDFL